MMQLQQGIRNTQEHTLTQLHPVQDYPKSPQREASVELDTEHGITVRKAITVDDMVKVFRVRWEGYKKYYKSEDENLDKNDFSPKTTLLLAEDKDHNAVGTIRIIDRRYGSIELDTFIDVDSFFSEEERECVEATRFSVPKHPHSQLIKLLLWKALLVYCQTNHINTILMSARPAAARSYRCLLFENVGPAGVYSHKLLGNLEHRTFKCNIPQRKYLLKKENWPLYQFFFVKDHANINIDYFKFCDPDTDVPHLSFMKGRIPINYHPHCHRGSLPAEENSDSPIKENSGVDLQINLV